MALICAYCYVPLQPSKAKRCGKCKRRRYCSQTCQVQDWRCTHRTHCGACGELGTDVEVRPSPLGGVGLFALRPFAPDERIMVERAISWQSLGREKTTMAAAMKLLPHGTSLRDKFELNQMRRDTCTDETILNTCSSTDGVLCVTMSRVNHACLPNCTYSTKYIGTDDDVHDGSNRREYKVLIASRPISSGEEITISYISSMSEKHMLWRKWHFHCTCHVCQDPTKGAQLRQCEELDAQFLIDAQRAQFGETERLPRAISACHQLLKLYDCLQRSAIAYLRTYYDLFQVCVMRRESLKKAQVAISLAVHYASRYHGNDSPKVTQMRDYADDMTRHPLYLCLEHISLPS